MHNIMLTHSKYIKFLAIAGMLTSLTACGVHMSQTPEEAGITKMVDKNGLNEPVSVWLVKETPFNKDSLQYTVSQTILQSAEVAKTRTSYMINMRNAGQAGKLYEPEVGFNAHGGWTDRNLENSDHKAGAGFNARLTLYDNGQSDHRVKQYQWDSKAHLNKHNDTKEATALIGVEAHHKLMKLTELKGNLEAELRALKSLRKMVETRVNGGGSPHSDLYKANIDLANKRIEINNLNEDLENAKSRYLRLTGTAPTKLFLENSAIDLDGRETAKQKALLHSAIQMLEATQQALIQEAMTIYAESGPSIGIDLGPVAWATVSAGTFNPFGFGAILLNLDQTIWDKKDIDTKFLNIVDQIRNKNADIDEIKRIVAFSIDQSYNRDETARKNEKEYRIIEVNGAKRVQALGAQYEAGKATITDLFEATKEKYLNERNTVSGRYDRSFAVYRVLSEQNLLVEYLDIADRFEVRVADSNFSFPQYQ